MLLFRSLFLTSTLTFLRKRYRCGGIKNNGIHNPSLSLRVLLLNNPCITKTVNNKPYYPGKELNSLDFYLFIYFSYRIWNVSNKKKLIFKQYFFDVCMCVPELLSEVSQHPGKFICLLIYSITRDLKILRNIYIPRRCIWP